MNDAEQKAVLTICLMAAFADGAKDEREREQIKRITGSLAPGAEIDPPEIYQDVLLKRRTLEDAAAEIKGREIRQFAYEMAVCVCADDGAGQNDSQRLDPQRSIGASPAIAGLDGHPAPADKVGVRHRQGLRV